MLDRNGDLLAAKNLYRLPAH